MIGRWTGYTGMYGTRYWVRVLVLGHRAPPTHVDLHPAIYVGRPGVVLTLYFVPIKITHAQEVLRFCLLLYVNNFRYY